MSRDFRIKITSGGILEERDHVWRLSRLHHWFSCAVPTFRRGDFRVRRYSKGESGRTILVNLNWTVENGSAKGRGEVRRLGAQIAAKIENPPTRGLRGLQSNWCYTQADKRAGGAPSARKFYQRNRCLPTEAVFVAPVTRLASQSLARSLGSQPRRADPRVHVAAKLPRSLGEASSFENCARHRTDRSPREALSTCCTKLRTIVMTCLNRHWLVTAIDTVTHVNKRGTNFLTVEKHFRVLFARNRFFCD